MLICDTEDTMTDQELTTMVVKAIKESLGGETHFVQQETCDTRSATIMDELGAIRKQTDRFETIEEFKKEQLQKAGIAANITRVIIIAIVALIGGVLYIAKSQPDPDKIAEYATRALVSKIDRMGTMGVSNNKEFVDGPY